MNYLKILCAVPVFCVLCAFVGAPEAPSADDQQSAPAPQIAQLDWPNADELGQDASSDPIGPIAHKMGRIVVDLKVLKTDAPVQTKEQRVLADLDAIIKELEKQCKSGGGGANANPTKPLQKSQIVGGPGGSGPLHDPNAGTRVWGQLPPKQREQILQSQTEGFPPGYESVLTSYYSRLAQGQAPDDAAAGAGPATQPTRP